MSSESSQDAIVPHTTKSRTSGARRSVTAEKWSNRRRRRGFSQSVFNSRGSHPSKLPRNHERRCPLRTVNPSSLPCTQGQGNRLKDLGCLAYECFEVAWVPSAELAAVFEACGC